MPAGGVLALIPVILFVVLVQKHIVKGLILGTLKG
jgi:ABC-type glycerol-3-phosphate transport system permease component